MPLQPNEILIDDDTPVIEPIGASKGYVPRDYSVYPVEMFAPPSEIVLIPKSEWSARIKEKEEQKSRLSDIRRAGNKGQPIPSLNQNSGRNDGRWGYCWAHSTAHTIIANRAVSNQPYVPLSAFAIAAIIKGGRNEGGWCGLSAKFAREVGIPSQSLWPQNNVSLSLDTAEMRANAALHKITEDWVDLTRDVYDQNLTFEMVISLLLSNVPVAVDFNWWGHSVCAMDAVEVEPGSFGIRIWNSWGDDWSDMGEGVLRGSKAIPDGAVATRVTGVSAA